MPSIVAQIADGDLVGRGEAAGVYYLGDDQDRMVGMIEKVRVEVEAGLTRERASVTIAAVRCAERTRLRLVGARSTATLLAGVAARRRSQAEAASHHIHIAGRDPSVLATKLDRLSFAKAIKLKLDGDAPTDRERIAVVRNGRPDAWIGVDANQGYTKSGLEDLARACRDFSIALIEQPLKRGDEASLEGWRPGVPVAADESILDFEELQARARYFDVINIKLDKCGGLTEALRMARSARLHGLQVMVGNMGGSTLAMAPGIRRRSVVRRR